MLMWFLYRRLMIPSLVKYLCATLTSAYPAGPLTLILQGSTYGFLPFMNGIYLQSTVMYPEVAAEPGCLAPGQSLTIACVPKAPVNIADMFSYDTGGTVGADITSGSSVVAYLVNSGGQYRCRYRFGLSEFQVTRYAAGSTQRCAWALHCLFVCWL